MISSASAQIEALGGDYFKVTIIKDGKPTKVPDYATVQGMLLGGIASFVIFITIIGPECVSSLAPQFIFVFIFTMRRTDIYFALPRGAGTTDRTLSNRRPRSRMQAQIVLGSLSHMQRATTKKKDMDILIPGR